MSTQSSLDSGNDNDDNQQPDDFDFTTSASFTAEEYQLVYHQTSYSPNDNNNNMPVRSAAIAHRFGKAESQLSLDQRNLLNRLKSIALDKEFVNRVRHGLLSFPVVGNLRAGLPSPIFPNIHQE